MANERTFLAWIRTSIGIIALGFVVEKFALFVKQMGFILNNSNLDFQFTPSKGYSTIIGFLLVILGIVTSAMAFIKFRLTAIQIENDNYRPFYLFDLILTVAVLIAGIMLAVYLKP